MEFFDSHAHLDDEKFNEDRCQIIKKIQKSETTKVISAGYSIEGSKKAIKLSEEYEFIYSTIRNITKRHSTNRRQNVERHRKNKRNNKKIL